MTAHHAAAATGLPKSPDYNDDQVLNDLYILPQQLEVAGHVCLDIAEGEATRQQLFALIETSRAYVSHIHRALTATAHRPNIAERENANGLK